ncbi:glutamate racemase [Motilimonas sp. 1_MG-2023]|uniref:glutamate racemase n=1 Tax=Motilimonas TaxID=1914248 RepID=UPI001E48106B|nr:glutamate racemase [Motilimonas sp. 1_MG-2023]MCE0559368.1 glutamate racemase [Motilimonas sp. E26]MDO6528119.1 glutamate racemase [Motilimonas sp. 1_MG-2023]
MSILIFDSGVGGLSIFAELQKQLPTVSMTYLFDNQYFPYGELDDQVLIERVCSLLTKAVNEFGSELVVIACNTASTLVLEPLRQILSIPVVGVVPAIKPAAMTTKNNCIGLLATPGTVARSYTDTLVRNFAADKTVLRIGSSELVKLAEQKLRMKPVDLDSLAAILAPWLLAEVKPDRVVLGCTHFPLLEEELKRVLGDDVELVDSGVAIAKRVTSLINITASNAELNIYCSLLNQETNELNPTLKKLGFSSLQLFTV